MSVKPRTKLFTQRELQFVELRYGQCLTWKEISAEMNISLRMVRWYSEKIHQRLELKRESGHQLRASLIAMKMLIGFGYIKVDFNP